MKICIIGLPGAGKKTLFQALTECEIKDKDISAPLLKGTVRVNDPRFDVLLGILNPKTSVRPAIKIELFQNTEERFSSNPQTINDIVKSDLICCVIRTFKDDSVCHIKGSIDPGRDIEIIRSEFFLSDLLFIEKRLERIDKDLKKIKDQTVQQERAFLNKIKGHLEKSLLLIDCNFNSQEKKIIAGYPFLTLKKIIFILNVSEPDIKNTKILEAIKGTYIDFTGIQICAKVESEIAFLEEKDRKQFFDVLGIQEPALHLLTRLCMKELNLISFFTIREGKATQWLLQKGSTAVDAASLIHTSMGKGFIRAEVIKYDDIIRLGTEQKVKQEGKMDREGREYILEDGDILNIHFNA